MAERSQREESSFAGFRCWTNPDATRVLAGEAAAASRELLLATHVAPPIRHVSVANPGTFVDLGPATEDAVVDAIQTNVADSLVVPIIGASGSGKSHLVLWIREMLVSDSESRRLIYVPKSRTSLAGVIELILEGCEGGNYDKLREDVRTAATAMSDRERALRLRNELVLQLAAVDGDPTDPAAQAREYVKGRLPALLNDAIFEEKLLADGGALQRVVEHATRGGNEDVAEFVVEDLLVDLSPSEQGDLGAPARQMLGRLENTQVRDAAIGLLNDVRDRAISAVFGVAPHQLLGVFEDLRREIQKETPGHRLVLMIEDFTLLQGIQHELLEAMIANARPNGELELAPMTTVMAVTKGFLQRVFTASSGGDTVRTRIADQGHVYSLDSVYGQADGYDPALARTMVGRYLNATRLSVGGLSYPDTPNACDACPHRDSCHEGFGTSTDGFGLYPFNDRALDRMARSTNDNFNPRSMLSSLQKTLTHHGEELAEGAFPSQEWARLFDAGANGVKHPPPTLSLEVQRAAEDTLRGEQRARLLTFWGGVPDRLGDLDPAIHEAFGIPLLGGQRARPAVAADAPDAIADERPKPTRDLVGERVQAWRDGGRLGADDAREVRRFIGQAMLEAFDAETRLTSRRAVDRLFNRERDVVIEKSQHGGGASGGTFKIEINRDREGIDLIEGILRAVDPRVPAAERVSAARWTFTGGGDRLALLAEVAEREAARFAKYVESRGAFERRDREALICALYLSGVMLGFGASDTAAGKVAAVFSNSPVATEHMPARLRALWKRLLERRSEDQNNVFALVELRQGTGTTLLGVDPTEILDVVQTFEKTWALPTVAPDGSAHQTLQLFSGLYEALEQARESLTEWRQEISALLGPDADWTASSKTVRAVLSDAVAYVRVAAPGSDVPTDVQISGAVREVDGVLTGWDTRRPHENARVLTKLPWPRLAPAREELARLQKALVRAIESAEASSSGTSQESPLTEFGTKLQTYVSTATTLLDQS